MELELRTVLLIIGLVVIAAILIHGLISIRQSNKPVDLTGIDLREQDAEGNIIRDGSGFDRHGVGVARIIDDNGEEIPVDSSVDDSQGETDPTKIDTNAVPQGSALDSSDTTINFDVALDGAEQNNGGSQLIIEEPISPVFDSPIQREKPISKFDFMRPKQSEPETKSAQATIIESDKGESALTEPEIVDPVIVEPVVKETVKETVKSTVKPTIIKPTTVEPVDPMDVLVLNVVGRDASELEGAQLLPLLLTLGFKFGEMDIFHRHASSAGHGDVLFSLANMVQPGIFDIDNMEQFSTTGVSLFMQLPHTQGNLETFNIMLNAAAKIAEEFDGQVLDGKRNILTNQLTHQYVERIRSVEQRVAASK